MEKKKIIEIIVLCLVGLVLIFFGIHKLVNSKKTIDVNVSTESDIAIDNESQYLIEMEADKKNVDQVASVDNNQQAKDNSLEKTPKEKLETKSVISEKNIESKTVMGKIVNNFVSWGFEKSTSRTIKAIILHTSYNAGSGDIFDKDKVIAQWKDYGVSPHYMIDRAGNVYQLVADQNIAYHAGISELPDGTTNVNDASIGIEIINSKDLKFTDAQYAALNDLIVILKKKYPIKFILGHDEIAPNRKTDPWNIDWKKVNR